MANENESSILSMCIGNINIIKTFNVSLVNDFYHVYIPDYYNQYKEVNIITNEIGMKRQEVGTSLLHISCEVTKKEDEPNVDKSIIQNCVVDTFGGGYLINIDQTDVYALIDIVVYGGSFETFKEFVEKMKDKFGEILAFASSSSYNFDKESTIFVDNKKSFFHRNR